MKIEVRPYAQGDETAICGLFETVFGRTMSVDYWRWRYAAAPAGGPLTELCWDGDRLAGHYGACAAFLSIDGVKRRAGLSMTTMVHPDYRGMRLFETSAERLYARMEADGDSMIYGFPNTVSHRTFNTRLGWRTTCEVPTLGWTAGGRPAPAVPGQVTPVEQFDARFDAFWDSVKGEARIWGWRDAAWLRWRFTDNPDHAYRAAAWVEAGQVGGYVVIKDYGDDALDIVDLVAFQRPAYEGLTAWALDHAASAGRSKAAIWMRLNEDARHFLEGLGFKATAPVTYFGGRPFAALAQGPDIYDPRNWRLAMSDSDVY